jgi:hypothetical protein
MRGLLFEYHDVFSHDSCVRYINGSLRLLSIFPSLSILAYDCCMRSSMCSLCQMTSHHRQPSQMQISCGHSLLKRFPWRELLLQLSPHTEYVCVCVCVCAHCFLLVSILCGVLSSLWCTLFSVLLLFVVVVSLVLTHPCAYTYIFACVTCSDFGAQPLSPMASFESPISRRSSTPPTSITPPVSLYGELPPPLLYPLPSPGGQVVQKPPRTYRHTFAWTRFPLLLVRPLTFTL